jgi:hypothetical protein
MIFYDESNAYHTNGSAILWQLLINQRLKRL